MAVDKKIVLITGAAAGIGLEAVKAIVGSQQASYEIILSARKLAQAQAAAEEIARALPSATSTTTPLEIDVSSDKSIEDAAELIKSRYGRIDVLVNNAGITPPTHHKLILRACFWLTNCKRSASRLFRCWWRAFPSRGLGQGLGHQRHQCPRHDAHLRAAPPAIQRPSTPIYH